MWNPGFQRWARWRGSLESRGSAGGLRERARRVQPTQRRGRLRAWRDGKWGPIISWAPRPPSVAAVESKVKTRCAGFLRALVAVGVWVAVALFSVGCANKEQGPDARQPSPSRPQVFVVAPVINLSGSSDFDPLQVTDIVASEFLSFPNTSVIPVNLTLAALARAGKTQVETPEDALELAREFGADATIVTAITEYDPYDPPIVGLVMQWYAVPPAVSHQGLDPVSASRQASGAGVPEEVAAVPETAPKWQVQRVFNAAHESILEEVRSFAAEREGHASPYAWRQYVKSQKLFLRFSIWSAIRPIHQQWRRCGVTTEVDKGPR